MDRYGANEVVSWPVEVWNEPNLPGFWKDANMEEYFKLYDVSSRAVKAVDKRFKVGGPAVCGGTDKEWIKAFLEFVRKNKCRSTLLPAITIRQKCLLTKDTTAIQNFTQKSSASVSWILPAE